jgi:hypothetical protein
LSGLAGAVIVTSTVADPPAGTVTFGELNAAIVPPRKVVPADPGAAFVAPPVESASTLLNAYVTADDPLLVRVSRRVCGPDALSPRASLPGAIRVVASAASSICTIPAPCRWTLSSPAPGAPHQPFGSAVFCRIDRTSSALPFSDGCFSSNSATVPATCGEDIDVPLIVA